MDRDRFLFDSVAAVVLFVLSFGGSVLPSFLKSRSTDQNGPGLLFQLGNMLSAGVMLSAGFCHLLPSAIADIQPSFDVQNCKEVPISSFPLATFLSGLGLLVTLMADQIAEALSAMYGLNHVHGHGKGDQQSQDHCNPTHTYDDDSKKLLDMSNSLSTQMFMSAASTEFHSMEIEYPSEENPSHPRVGMVTALLLSMALSLHSILEGAALGSQQTLKASRNIIIAILAHKGLAAYALGASLAESSMSKHHFWPLIFGFSMASPLGIFSGYAVSEVASGAIASSLSALASGTFLYVAVFEVIPKEMATEERKFVKLSAMIAGFGLMSMLAIWA